MNVFGKATLLTTLLATSIAEDPLVGKWQTVADDHGNYGHVEISVCDTSLCGVWFKAYGADGKKRESENIGRTLIWDMKNQGDGNYGNGKIDSPDRDKTIFWSKLVLEGDALKACQDAVTVYLPRWRYMVTSQMKPGS